MQGDDGVLHLLALRHLFGQCLGKGHHEQGTWGLLVGLDVRVGLSLDMGLNGRQCFGAQYLVGRVDLPVLDAAFIAAGEERHASFATYLNEVVIEVAGFLFVVEDEDDDAVDGTLERSQEGGGSRTRKSLELYDGRLRGVHSPKFFDKCIESGLLQHQVFDFHKQETETL